MAKISSYTTVTPPALTDRVIGTDSVGTPTDSTKNFLIGDIVGLVTTPDLSAVLTAGNSASNNITLTGSGILTAVATNSVTLDVSGQATLSGNTTFSSTITAGNGTGVGIAGQALASRGAGLSPQWITLAGIPTLTMVLNAGDDGGNNNITNITTTTTDNLVINAGTLTANSSTGTLGQLLQSTTTGITWVSSVDLTTVKTDNLEIDGGTVTAGGSTGVAGQVLSSTATGVQWINAASGTTLSTTTALTSADILALNTTPKTIVSGVAGKHIVPIKIVAKYEFVTTAYTVVSVGLIYLGAATNASTSYIFSADIVTGVADGTFINSTDNITSNQTPKYNTAGGGDDLLFGWRTADPTLGDGRLEMTVIYSLVDA